MSWSPSVSSSRSLTPSQRLVVAADFTPNLRQGHGRSWARVQLLRLAASLQGSGVTLKVNSLLRALGYDVIDILHRMKLDLFADLKLIDTKESLAIDGLFLQETRPKIVTAMCSAGQDALISLRGILAESELVGVTVPTSMSELDCKRIYDCEIKEAVRRLAALAQHSKLVGVVCAPREVESVRKIFGSSLEIYAAGIRPVWMPVENDDQNRNRVMPPVDALKAGADYLIVGRPITKADNPADATKRIIDEIASVV